ncbi:MAG: GDSL-type esterase/lipase family protein [Pseudomonadota bacterium]
MRQALLFAGSTIILAACASNPKADVPQNTDYTVSSPAQISAAGVTEIEWPGSVIETVFTGDTLTMTLTDTGDSWLDVEINGEQQVLDLQPGRLTYRLIEDVPGTHDVRIALRTERPYRPIRFEGFDPADGTLSAPDPAALKMLVIGDDVAAGYGVEGEDQHCRYSPATHNANKTFAATAARALDADLSIIARSGRGLLSNWAGDTAATLPQLYTSVMSEGTTTMPDDMDVVVLLMGMADFSETDPGQAFDAAYVDFMGQIRADQPDALIVAGWGPMGRSEAYDAAKAAVLGAVEMRKAAGDKNVDFIEFSNSPDGQLYGCDWHPSADTQAFMGDALLSLLKDHGVERP